MDKRDMNSALRQDTVHVRDESEAKPLRNDSDCSIRLPSELLVLASLCVYDSSRVRLNRVKNSDRTRNNDVKNLSQRPTAADLTAGGNKQLT